MPTIRERNGKFQVQVRIKDSGQIVFSESNTFDTRKQAQLWGLSLEKKIREEGVETFRAKSLLVADALDVYEAAQNKVKRRRKLYELDALRAAPFAQTSACDLRTSDVTRWAVDYAADRAPATVMRTIAILHSAMETARVVKGVEVNVAAVTAAAERLRRVGLSLPSKARDRRISDAEIETLVQAASAIPTNIPMGTIIRLAVALPRRLSELLSMRWADYQDGVIILRDTKHPTAPRTEVVPVPPAAQQILTTLPRSGDVILPYKADRVSHLFTQAAREAGVKQVVFHGLRHEGISRLFDRGLDIPAVAMVSGHLSWATLKRYTHLRPQDVLEKLNACS